MLGYYYGFDITYLFLVLPCIIISLWASMNVKSTFNKYSQVFSSRRITGSDAAKRVLQANGISNIRVERISGHLTDHFDPRTNVIRLSEQVFDSTSIAAIGVACHEAGHAVQHATQYAPIKLRTAIIPVTNIGSRLAMPLILVGILLSYLGNFSYTLVYIGIGCFALTLLFELITLPVELNASNRAIRAIDEYGMLNTAEIKGAKKTLQAAALTYIAAAAVTLAQLLRLILLFGGRRRSRD